MAKREAITGGLRPTIPPHADVAYVTLMKKCWDTNPRLRPNFTEIFIDLVNIRDAGGYQKKAAPNRASYLGIARMSSMQGPAVPSGPTPFLFSGFSDAPVRPLHSSAMYQMPTRKIRKRTSAQVGAVGREKRQVCVVCVM